MIRVNSFLGCTIGSAMGNTIRVDEPNVNPKHITIQHKTEFLDSGQNSFFEVLFHAFGQYNGKLTPAQVIQFSSFSLK